MRKSVIGIAAAMMVVVETGCGGGGGNQTYILYKDAGSKQCYPSQATKTQLDSLISSLNSDGVIVLTDGCASDSSIGTNTCGASAGEMFYVEVGQSDIEKLKSQGFMSSDNFQNAKKFECH